MAENQIVVPETIQFYYERPVNWEAIDIIINTKVPPKDSKWEELHEFYTAQLAAKKTQYDFWCFINEICKVLWDDKVIRLNNFFEVDNVDYNGENRLEKVWSDSQIYKTYNIESNYQFCFGCYIESEKGLSLWCYLQENQDEKYPSSTWELSDKWNPDPEDDVRNTSKMLPIVSNTNFNLQPLHEATDEIMYILKGVIK
ncbi:MAG: hypothetical protein K8S13_08050 [Desulfobacula sp.]|uniref:hypothetical protein n=1 Tax=Desulfobacula sp. TaxID=2593537 RepID=UPI0025BCC02B|nr:hypothetical protein [Desulfobacula sp.]MCD4719800.1 hypothetical protein [Desulfobacula sp.]